VKEIEKPWLAGMSVSTAAIPRPGLLVKVEILCFNCLDDDQVWTSLDSDIRSARIAKRTTI
jgi:hypothetical protein